MRRTLHQVRIETIVDERAGVLSLARARGKQMVAAAQAGRGHLSEDMAGYGLQLLAAFAGDIAIGLHVSGEQPAEVRDAMRLAVKGQDDG